MCDNEEPQQWGFPPFIRGLMEGPGGKWLGMCWGTKPGNDGGGGAGAGKCHSNKSRRRINGAPEDGATGLTVRTPRS